ncbi:uncharacterized protein BYT42DRAFT_549145 [Radiomyces spectabilis]|uniref:uncharacterized protein n=1 Tax=Radiomyces spectabilis TaxID=64574 RepID=UPI00221F01E8|nr:uncharacterized protein BYT42DRAFT_549145 [Radiomyces spectabilis]KAI8369461.1 hypothetical protein BYT42DRAFT_549145 [Radiomyces spectabilis]
MAYCRRCGELCRSDSCKKCGSSSLTSSSTFLKSSIDRWQSSYLGNIVGLDPRPIRKSESTSIAGFLMDNNHRIFHPDCATQIPVSLKCGGCSSSITDTYVSVNNCAFHIKCFQCVSCAKSLYPSTIYADMEGAHCQACISEKFPELDNAALSHHVKIVPQPQTLSSGTMLSAITSEGSISSSAATSRCTSPTDSSMPSSASSPCILSPTVARGASSLMSSRDRPLPKFGTSKTCPGCQKRILSVYEEKTGPLATRWHSKCLACTRCSKALDSAAVLQKDEVGSQKPWCTACLARHETY